MHSEIKYWFLRDHKLFRVLSNDQLKQLCVITGFKEGKKGDIIYFSDSKEPRIYFLKKGAIKISEVDVNGNEITKEIIQKGDLFGELSLDTTIANNEFAQVLTNSVTICSFLLKDFEALMEQHPDLALSYTKLVGLKFKKLKNSYSNLVFKDARSRLIQFLKDWAARDGNETLDAIVIENYLTQQDIAHIICTTRQTATQLLNQLETEGHLKYDRKELVLDKQFVLQN
ncbi:MAG: Crp/Fnr family transcriptional regulator [Bacteroidia bacterium]|jgi:CRP-like cAMP-binding protein|nr:Crp/Fnr family transcriptional regulator [Bacteroidia bacterium]